MNDMTQKPEKKSRKRIGSQQDLPEARELADRALASEKGIEISFPDERTATAMKVNILKLRSRDRQRNAKIFKPGDPLYGASAYDILAPKVKGNTLLIYKGVGSIPIDGLQIKPIE